MERKMRIFLGSVGLLTVLAGLVYISTVNYLLFHSLVEGFSIIIAFGIFFVAWNSRDFVQNNYLLFLGLAYPFIATIDFLHLLSYRGMEVFEGYGANLPTQLWIQARYMEAVTLLLAPLFFNRRVREILVLAAYTAVTALFVVTVFTVKIFPDCFVEPAGLTQFKRVSEYIISLILVAALVMVIRRREQISPTMLRFLSASIVTTIAAELSFTFYISVYGLSNMVGHLLKILSFYFIYKGIIEVCLRDPYSSLFLELKKQEGELRKAEGELLVRNRELEAFLHTAAHDLRTPLVSIGGYAYLLERSWEKIETERRGEMLGHIRRSIKRMSKLLHDLLDFAFVGRQAAEPVRIDTKEMIRRIVEELRDQVDATGAQIVLSDHLPTLYMPDTEAYQLFSNVISNGIKFSQSEMSPRIEIGVEEEEEGFVTISVTDNGIGVAPEDLERIFDLFVTLENGQTGGTGAGLAIVKRIVEHNGGSIHVESEPGIGTTFTLTLPVA